MRDHYSKGVSFSAFVAIVSMGLAKRILIWEPVRFVGWKAERITDPVERLAFLRVQMDDRSLVTRRPTWFRLSIGAVVIVLFSVLLPTPIVVSDIAGPKVRTDLAAFSPTIQPLSKVWLVEETDQHEVYSNGLRIETAFSVQNQSRFYQVLDRKRGLQTVQEWRSEPVGIVFHTTESHMAPFDPEQNENLKHLAKGLLSTLRESRSYNFLIDRFGRVFRIVDERSVANHAGNSIWSDQSSVYLNLNNSFLAISFEAQTGNAEAPSGVNQAQIHAGRILTEMLRSRYRIPTENCITHAQVSVNPSNMRIGYHTDWAHGFPFEEIGLPNNYNLELASVRDFGFEFDSVFQQAVGPALWPGLSESEASFERAAAAHHTGLIAFRNQQRARYQRLYGALKSTGALEEISDGTNSSQ